MMGHVVYTELLICLLLSRDCINILATNINVLILNLLIIVFRVWNDTGILILGQCIIRRLLFWLTLHKVSLKPIPIYRMQGQSWIILWHRRFVNSIYYLLSDRMVCGRKGLRNCWVIKEVLGLYIILGSIEKTLSVILFSILVSVLDDFWLEWLELFVWNQILIIRSLSFRIS